MVVQTAALCGIGAVLLQVPSLSASLPAYFSLPLVAFWLLAWYLDARFTVKHWRLVQEKREANVFVLALARLAPNRPPLVIVAHFAFSVVAAAGLQALVTHSLDYFVLSCILAIFGILHVDAFYHSHMFVVKVQLAGDQNALRRHLR